MTKTQIARADNALQTLYQSAQLDMDRCYEVDYAWEALDEFIRRVEEENALE